MRSKLLHFAHVPAILIAFFRIPSGARVSPTFTNNAYSFPKFSFLFCRLLFLFFFFFFFFLAFSSPIALPHLNVRNPLCLALLTIIKR
jgi:hypothetical protein